MVFRNIKYGIENLIKWFPIIVRDRDWDFAYLLEIMKFKIQNMQHAAETWWITENADKREMRATVELLDYFLGNEIYFDDDKYISNKEALTALLSKFDCWWD